MKLKEFFPRARDAITGRFIPIAYAIQHPQTTVIEMVKAIRKSKHK